MRFAGLSLRRAVPLLGVFAAMACGQGLGGGGCGPPLDANKIAAEAKNGGPSAKDAAARSAAADAVIAAGKGYKKDGYPDSVASFGGGGGSGVPGSPKNEFARLAQSLPPTPENQALIEKAMGEAAARSGAGGSTDLAGNGGYVTVATGKDGQPVWQWNGYTPKHSAPAGFEKPYVAPAGSAPATPAAAPASAAPASADADPALTPPAGFTGCWPKPPPLNHINLNLMGGNGNRRVVDSTPIVCARDYCAAVMHDPNRGCCPLRPEGDPMRGKCEAEVMGKDKDGRVGPRWQFKGNGGVEKQPDNAYLAWGYGNGWVGACSNVAPICNWIEVINHPETSTATVAGAGGGGGGGSSAPTSTGGAPKSSTPGSSHGVGTPSTSTAPISGPGTPDEDAEPALVPVIPPVAPPR